jgi:predicted AAA+ superfamily ATPase
MDPTIRRTVEHLNPWILNPAARDRRVRAQLPPAMLPRLASGDLSAVAGDTRKAHLVVGPRQAGKSTLVWSLAAEAEHLLYLNCEEPLVRQWCTSAASFVHEAADFLPPGGFLFLEEAQWLDEAGLFVKGIVDSRPGWVVFVTGSASFHLLSRTRESLAGRATRHHVWPLSLAEVGAADGLVPAARHAARRDAVARMMLLGGYPEAWTSPKPEAVLRELVDAFVLRDASDRFRIARPDAFRLLMSLAARQVGDLVNHSEWAGILGISPPTVAEYVALLEETHIVRSVRPFIGGKRAELTSAPKVFFVDNGLRNMLAGGFEPLERRADVGKLFENWVFSELHKRYPSPGEVRYWRSKGGAEVDFVLEPTPGRLVAIEVKAQARGRPPLSRSARSFIDAYAPAELLLVHRGEAHTEQVGATLVRWVPAEVLPEALP